MPVNAAAFVPPTFIPACIYFYQNGIPALVAIAQNVRQVVVSQRVTTLMITEQMAIHPNGAVPENAVKFYSNLFSSVRFRYFKFLPVKTDARRQISIARRLTSQCVVIYK